LLGFSLHLIGWAPRQETAAAADSLRQALKEDVKVNLDIRTASLEELGTLPSIGTKRAADIIAFREQAPFRSVNELLLVKGIGAKTYAKLLPYLLVFGDSTNLEAETGKPDKARKSTPKNEKARSDTSRVINLNNASLEDFCSLSGIGEKKAQAILDWRSANGPFSSVDDLTKVKGIGAKTLQKNRHRLTVD